MMRLSAFWAAVEARINTVTLGNALGGMARIYKPTDEIPPQEAAADVPWGRVVMRPALWPSRAEPGAPVNVAWVMSVQLNDFEASGYDPDIAIQAAHEEIFKRLDGFTPAPLANVLVYVPVWRAVDPPASAIYDDARRLWVSDAEYRTQVAP